jgi:hypothetical protein
MYAKHFAVAVALCSLAQEFINERTRQRRPSRGNFRRGYSGIRQRLLHRVAKQMAEVLAHCEADVVKICGPWEQWALRGGDTRLDLSLCIF